MHIYRLDLSWSELDSLKAAMNNTIKDLDKCHQMLNSKLDGPVSPELYNQYMEFVANVSRDKINMRSILCKAELSHD